MWEYQDQIYYQYFRKNFEVVLLFVEYFYEQEKETEEKYVQRIFQGRQAIDE